MLGVGLDEGIDAAAIGADLLERGLIVNVPEPGTLRLLPPLTVDSDQIERAVATIDGRAPKLRASMSSRKRPSEPRALTSGTAERLAAIVEAAEQAAAKVIDDAEEQARRQLAEAGARADRIVAERLRALADELDPPASAPAASRT